MLIFLRYATDEIEIQDGTVVSNRIENKNLMIIYNFMLKTQIQMYALHLQINI